MQQAGFQRIGFISEPEPLAGIRMAACLHVTSETANGVPLGLTICYDLRFPELYRILALRGARIVTVPANFTRVTGEAHWEVLLRARAIENQCFVAAAAQWGSSDRLRSLGVRTVTR